MQIGIDLVEVGVHHRGTMPVGTSIRLATAFAVAVALPAHGSDARLCEGGQVSVAADEAALGKRICKVAETAIAGLAACNVVVDQLVTISVVEALPGHCTGLYHCGENLIELLTPEQAHAGREADSPFRDLPRDAYFDSIVVHELAHAAFDAVPCPFPDCPATAEYLAYAMQVRSLTREQIGAFEADSDLDEPVSAGDISVMILKMAPDLFAAEAWSHFSTRPDPCGYAGLIMDGAIRFDRERP